MITTEFTTTNELDSELTRIAEYSKVSKNYLLNRILVKEIMLFKELDSRLTRELYIKYHDDLEKIKCIK